MALFKIFKGNSSNLPKTYKDGYCYFTVNDGKMYIDTKDSDSTGRICLNAAKADSATKDNKGNIISSTYLPLSGGTMTGNVTMNNNTKTTYNLTIKNDYTVNSPTEQPITINAGLASGIELTDRNAPGIGFHVGNTTWGNLILTKSGFKFINNTRDVLMSIYAARLYGNVTGNLTGNADTASKLATTRNIALTGDVTGNVNFDGSGNVSITTTNKHGLLHSNFTTFIPENITSGGWELIDSSYNKSGFFLKSIRTSNVAPTWILGDYASGIAFGGHDTKGVMSVAYSSPQVKFAGGNGMTPVWNFQLNATSGQTYTFPSVGGTVALTTSNVTSATKLQTARTIQTNLASTSTASFNGTTNITPGVTGTLGVGNGGTGKTSFSAGYLIIGNGTSALKTTNIHVNYSPGTASTTGYEELVIGNSTSAGTAGNTVGKLSLYSSKNAGVYLVAADATSWSYTNILPASNGTLLNTSNYSTYALPKSGGTLSGSITISHAANNIMDKTTTNPRIVFADQGTQPVGLVYTDYDNYRSPAGLKVLNMSDNGKAWFEVEGDVYASSFIGPLSGNASTATKLQNTRTLTIGNTGKNFDGSANVSWSHAEMGVLSLTGGTMSGDISFKTIATWPTAEGETYPIVSKGLYWSGSSDFAKIFFRVTGSDKGQLVMQMGDGSDEVVVIENSAGTNYATMGRDGITATNFYGNASSASKLQTARTLTIGNKGQTFDGSGNVSWALHDILYNPTAIGATSSWNITTPGIYAVQVGGSSNPFSGEGNPESANGGLAPYRYGQLIVSRASSFGMAQFYIAHTASSGGVGIKYRSGWNSQYVDKWVSILDSGNYNNYAPTKTGTGASGTWGISISGNAATATKLATARTISLTGDVTGSGSFDGSGNLSITATVADNSHNHTFLTSPGRHTEVASSTTASSPSAGLLYSKGLYMTENYNDANTPVNYGNIINVAGAGTSQIFCEWSGSDNTTGGMFYRSHRDTATGGWGGWRRIWLQGDAVTGAVWNDYAEYRESDCEEFGYVLSENGDDTLLKTTERLQHFAGVSSDTWGFSQGETDKAKTPIAVAGRVLVYPYQDRYNYKPGDCVCAAPGGTVDIMTREEIINWPDRIVGTVSCVPDYEEWGGGEMADRSAVKVNGRIWIKVK